MQLSTTLGIACPESLEGKHKKDFFKNEYRKLKITVIGTEYHMSLAVLIKLPKSQPNRYWN